VCGRPVSEVEHGLEIRSPLSADRRIAVYDDAKRGCGLSREQRQSE
jgi:hypothetical protein